MKNNSRRESAKGLFREIEAILEVALLSFIYYLVWHNFYNDGPVVLFLGKGKYILMGVYAMFSYIFIRNIDGFKFGDLHRIDLGLAQFIGLIITNFLTYFQLCLISNYMIPVMPMLLP